MKAVNLTLVLLLAGCTSYEITNSCKELAVESNWEVLKEPEKEISRLLYLSEETDIWLKNTDGKYAVCSPCQGGADRASSFGYVDEQSEIKIEKLVIQNCGPY